jgi:DNA-binding protein HU-beta
MTKAELIANVANSSGTKKSVAEKVLNAFLDTIADALKAKEGKITLTGFGTFSVVERAARMGRNPRTGKEIKIPSCKIPKFKPGNKLKEKIG